MIIEIKVTIAGMSAVSEFPVRQASSSDQDSSFLVKACVSLFLIPCRYESVVVASVDPKHVIMRGGFP